MSNLDEGREALPPSQPAEGWFEPTPAKLIEQLPTIGARFGQKSMEYVALLVQLGDAHRMQGRLSNPQAQASYEAALEILQAKGADTPEVAWLYDKLASVKESSGNSLGAQADLEKALRFWKMHPPSDVIPRVISANHVARREEDLQRLKRLNEFKNRRPPPV